MSQGEKHGLHSITTSKLGILSQEYDDGLQPVAPNNTISYIAASYVKYVEGAGARVVPIR